MNQDKRILHWIFGFMLGLVVPTGLFIIGGFLFLAFPPDGIGLEGLPYLVFFIIVIALALSFRHYLFLREESNYLAPGYLAGLIVSGILGPLILFLI